MKGLTPDGYEWHTEDHEAGTRLVYANYTGNLSVVDLTGFISASIDQRERERAAPEVVLPEWSATVCTVDGPITVYGDTQERVQELIRRYQDGHC